MPNGVYFSRHPMSWSTAWLSPRVVPPREYSPMFTVALQSMLRRMTVAAFDPGWSLSWMLAKMASVSGSFFGVWP